MGFCRRCGELVTINAARCTCGGASVAAVVPFGKTVKEQSQDLWSKTYMSRERSLSPLRSTTFLNAPSVVSQQHTGSSTGGAKRFLRPKSTSVLPASGMNTRVSDYITSTTSQANRPPSPLKYSTTMADPDSDILPSLSPLDSTLSKVYGSVLQPKESLVTHSCAICATIFPPDATIYPDPSSVASFGTRFLCRPCYTENGGSKGLCAACNKPVLTLKTEGGFIHAANKYWHKKCFNCEGCFKSIGNTPTVDLLGRPSCPECFDSCLKRDPSTPNKSRPSNPNSPGLNKVGNLGGMSINRRGSSNLQRSPAIDELEQRLGITKSRDSSPSIDELSQRLHAIGKDVDSRQFSGSPTTSPLPERSRARSESRLEMNASPIRRHSQVLSPESNNSRSRSSYNTSPVRRQGTGSPVPTQEAIDEMKPRLLHTSQSPTVINAVSKDSSSIRSPVRISSTRSSTSLLNGPCNTSLDFGDPKNSRSSNIPPTPDLISDFSDTMTQSSFSSPDTRDGYSDADVFSTVKLFGCGFGSRHTRKQFLEDPEDVIVEETSSQLCTPTRTPNAKETLASTPTCTPSKKSASSPLPGKINKITSPILQSREPNNVFASTSHGNNATACAKCYGQLFSGRDAISYVVLPSGDENVPSKTYHTSCFTCTKCEEIFQASGKGQAIYVKVNSQPYHIECAPPQKILIRESPRSTEIQNEYSDYPHSTFATVSSSATQLSTSPIRQSPLIATSSKCEKPLSTAPALATSFPRFGSRTACPGCHHNVSPMERGVVPGPQGTRWHATCLVCGGKKEPVKGFAFSRGRTEKINQPGCGKKLDSAAKNDGEGGVWCRECLLKLGLGGSSPQTSPTRSPIKALTPSFTGSSNRIAVQTTGTTGTTVARQFTGLASGNDLTLLRQLTGGGSSPTRSISPTKQLAMMAGGMRPRPKSVIGMRNTRSIDEGRGMYLVRQLTGSTGN